MYKHKKDHDALFEAFQQVQENQQIDERGGWWDKTLAKSPIAGMFGGVSQRAQGRVTSKNDSKQMMDRFWQTLGRNNQPVDAQQLANFISKQVPGIDTTKIPEIQNLSGTVTPKQVSQMMPQIVDQIHSVKAGGGPAPEPEEEVDPNSILNGDNPPPPGGGTDENPPPGDGTDEQPPAGGESVEELKAQIEQLKAQLAATQQGGGDGSGPPAGGDDNGPPPGGEPPQFKPGDMVSWGPGTGGDVVSVSPDGSQVTVKDHLSNSTYPINTDKLQLID